MERKRLNLRARSNNKISSAKELAKALGGYESSPGQYMAKCPAHDDRNPSLSIAKGNDIDILLYCHAGCKFEDIRDALKLQGIELNGTSLRRHQGLPKGISTTMQEKRYVAHWPYPNEKGEIIGYTVRYEAENGEKIVLPYFKRQDDTWNTGYPSSLKDHRPLYRLDGIFSASPEEVVYIVEGEKCTDALVDYGFIATTSPGGAKAASKADWKPLSGRRIIIWPDNDSAGNEYAINVHNELLKIGDSDQDIHLVDIEKLDLGEKEDVVDFIGRGATKKDIHNLPLRPVSNASDFGVIIIDEGAIWRAIDQAEALLLKAEPYALFNQGNRPVSMFNSKNRDITGNVDYTVGLTGISSSYLTDLWNRNITFMRRTEDGLTAVDPPSKLANRYLSNPGRWNVKPLSGLIFSPTIKPDGTILDNPGYDEISGLYYADNKTKFLPVDRNADREVAIAALNRLRHPFKDFPFVTPADESVLIAAILTALMRKSISKAPLFGFTAPVAGSGKTLLADCVSIIATGHPATATPQGRDKEEERKQLASILLKGNPIVLIDNVEYPLKSDLLSEILTAPGDTYTDRILGKSEMVVVSTKVTFLVTGNNLVIQGDMTRRALVCMIDPKVERPEAREDFKIKNLEKHLIIYRAKYVQAGLNIMKAYINEGKPKQDIDQYGSFEDWSDLIRSALVWLGMPDPNDTRKRIEENDPEKMNLRRVMNAWWEIYKDDDITTSEIVANCNKAIRDSDIESDEYELGQALIEATRTKGRFLNGLYVGNYLRSHKERILDGYMIVVDKDASKKSVNNWKLKKFEW